MQIPQRPTPLRGLLIGVLALTGFAATAVEMTAGGSGSGAPVSAQVAAAQTVLNADGARNDAARGVDEGGRHGDGGHHH